MTDQIKYAQSQADKFINAMADCHESMDSFYFNKANEWLNHVADLKKQHEQQRVAK